MEKYSFEKPARPETDISKNVFNEEESPGFSVKYTEQELQEKIVAVENVSKEVGEIEHTLEGLLQDTITLQDDTGNTRTVNTKKWRSLLTVGVLAAGLGKAGAEEQTQQISEVPENKTQEIVTDHLGLDIEQIRKDFTVSVQVDRGKNDKYIVHIGQRHAHPSKEYRDSDQKERVIEDQKKIEGLLLDLQANGLEGVFSESFTEPSSNKEYYKVEFHTLLFNFKKGVREGMQLLLRKHQKLVSEVESLERKDVRTLIAIYDLLSRIQDNKQTLQSVKEEEEAYKIFESLWEHYEKHGEREMLYHGAAHKLFMEAEVMILPTEKQYDDNRISAMTSFQRIREMGTEIEKISEGGDTQQERERIAELYKEYEQEKENFLENAVEPRENTTLSFVRKHHKKVGGVNYIPLIYGEAHDFANNVREYNDSNKDTDPDFGLIRLTPKGETKKQKK